MLQSILSPKKWGLLLTIILISACSQQEQTPHISIDPTHTPTEPIEQPVISSTTIYDAALFNSSFDDGVPFGISGTNHRWELRSDPNGNYYYCNLPGDDWTSFSFGKEIWSNYGVQVQIRFMADQPDQFGELYFRVDHDVNGYRAGINNQGWASIAYYPPSTNLADSEIGLPEGEWTQLQIKVYGDKIEFLVNERLILNIDDDKRSSGSSGVGASPGTELCVDDILVWGLDENGYPHEPDPELIVKDEIEIHYSIREKISNKSTIPVFYPWAGQCENDSQFYFDCDTQDTPYQMIWTASGIDPDIASLENTVELDQSRFMQSDPDTLYLISEEWHYWNTNWRYLSPESKFYLEETFQQHVNSEYGDTKMINFLHPDWPEFLGQKAANFKEAGFDGVMLDWWHDHAGNGRSEEIVQDARVKIIQALRDAVGEDFILMGNVGWSVNDPTAPYLSGVFLELWNLDPSKPYKLTYNDEDQSYWDPSIERMEDLLIYWDQNLAWPRIIGFEPFKVTTTDFIEDRYSEENVNFARLYAAMAVVIPENGYFLYADHNNDWDGGDHQHAYYEFYLTDLGQPRSGMIQESDGVSYKLFEKGVVAYNRTGQTAQIEMPDGRTIIIKALSGEFISDEDY